MFGLIEICLLAAAAVCLLVRFLPWLGAYRALFRGGAALLLISAVFPRTGNPIGQFLFGKTGYGLHLPPEMFAVAWWVMGACLCKTLLDLVLRRTLFPHNDEPHARRPSSTSVRNDFSTDFEGEPVGCSNCPELRIENALNNGSIISGTVQRDTRGRGRVEFSLENQQYWFRLRAASSP